MAYTGNNRDKTLSTYVSIKNSIADNTAIQDKLSFDENDEPTIRSLFRETNLKKFLDDQDIINTLNKKLGHYKDRSKDELNLVREDSKESSELIDRAIDFNENSECKDEYVANIFTIKDSDSGILVGIKVERRTNDNTRQAQQMAYNRALNLRLIDILKLVIPALFNVYLIALYKFIPEFKVKFNLACLNLAINLLEHKIITSFVFLSPKEFEIYKTPPLKILCVPLFL